MAKSNWPSTFKCFDVCGKKCWTFASKLNEWPWPNVFGRLRPYLMDVEGQNIGPCESKLNGSPRTFNLSADYHLKWTCTSVSNGRPRRAYGPRFKLRATSKWNGGGRPFQTAVWVRFKRLETAVMNGIGRPS